MMRYTKWIIGCWLAVILMTNACASELVPGFAAWLYGYNKFWVLDLTNYNDNAKVSFRFQYLFPKAGVISYEKNQQRPKLSYDSEVVKSYHQAFPTAVILPLITTTAAKDLDPAAANMIAQAIKNEPYAQGVEMDVEPFSIAQIPFYKSLAEELALQHKFLGIFLRAEDLSPELIQVLNENCFVILYGYDLRNSQDPQDKALPPEQYAKRLQTAAQRFSDQAIQAKLHFMIGLPAIATMHEWQIEKHCPRVGHCIISYHGYPLQDYFSRGLDITRKITSPYYLGVALWAFTNPSSSNQYFPISISSEIWQSLTSLNDSYVPGRAQ